MKLMLLVVSLLLTACAGQPQQFDLGKATDTDLWAYTATQCPTLTNEIEWTYSLPKEAMVFMNVHRNADVQGITTLSTVEYAFWMRNAMACIDRDVNLVKYNGGDLAVEYNGWVAMRDEPWVGHARDRAFTEFKQLGDSRGTWHVIN